VEALLPPPVKTTTAATTAAITPSAASPEVSHSPRRPANVVDRLGSVRR
jgi:hypothetical protein